MHYFFKNFFSLHPVIDQTNWEYGNADQWKFYQNCKLHGHRGRDSCAKAWPYSVHAIFFPFSCLHWGKDQTNFKYIVTMTNEGSIKVVNFMTHGARVLMLGHDHICHYRNYFLLYQYTAFCVSHNKCCFKWNLNSVAWFNKWNRFTGVRLNVYSMCSFWSSFWILTPYR